MMLRRRAGLGSLLLASTFTLLGCPGIGSVIGPVGVSATAGNGSTGTNVAVTGTPGSSAPLPFGTPNFPVPKAIVPPPPVAGVGPTPLPTTAPDKPATTAATPVPGASPLVAPAPVPVPLSYYVKPTLGEFAVTYYKDGGNDSTTGKPVKFSDMTGVAVDEKGDRFFTDSGNNTVRVLTEQADPVLGVAKSLQFIASTIAEKGPDGKLLAFNNPRGIAIGPTGNLLVVDSGNQAIRLGVLTTGLTYNFFTLAGGGAAGYADFVGKDAQFNDPYGVAVDPSGNAYVTDTNNNCIRKITPAQVVGTLAGSQTAGKSDGTGKTAGFSGPKGIAIDATGVLYVADTGNHLIRKVTSDGIVTTFAGSGQAGFKNGLGTGAQFNSPIGIAVDATGVVYVSEKGSNELRKITPQGAVTTLAGTDDNTAGWVDGPGTTARYSDARGLAVEKLTNIVYVIDAGNNALRQVQPVHSVTTLAGKGRPIQAPSIPIANSPVLFPLVVANSGQCCAGSTTAGFTDGNATTAQFNEPWAVVADASYNLYVADATNNCIRKVTPDGTVTTLAGDGHAGFADGRGNRARFNAPRALAFDGAGNLVVADQLNNCIRKVAPDGSVTTLAGDVDPAHPPGFKNGTLDVASFNNPTGVVVDAAGNVIVADRGNNVIRKISRTGVTTLAGDGTAGYKDAPAGKDARFVFPSGIAIDTKGTLYVTDYGNNAVRVIAPDTTTVGTLAGGGITPGLTTPGWVDGKGTAALFNDPWGLCVDDQGLVYVSDYGNSVIRRIDGQGNVVTFAGSIPTSTSTSTLSPNSGYSDGPALGAAFAAPAGICLDAQGYLYVADSKNHRIRKIH